MTEPPESQQREDRNTARNELEQLAAAWSDSSDSVDPKDAGGIMEQRSLFKDAALRFFTNWVAVVALVTVIVFSALSIFVPWDASWNPLHSEASATTFDFAKANLKPSFEHPFGTDPQGRDMWKRAWIGGRVSLAIGISVALVILVIGVAYGSISGYLGGRTDNLMMRLLDSLYGLPYLPFAIIIVTIVRQNFPADATPLYYMVPALSLTAWFTAARVTRGQILSLKENEYIESARAQGASWQRIIRRHLLPNIAGLMVVVIALEVPGAIMGEAMLSYLGLGVAPPNTSWGALALDGTDYFSVAPHLVWVPAMLIAITVLATFAISDGLRDALDPRSENGLRESGPVTASASDDDTAPAAT